MKLREYQSKALYDCRILYGKGKKAILLVMPTGSGKTYTFSYMSELAIIKANPSLILVHREELINQTSETLTSLGVEHGIIKAGIEMTPTATVQIASVQTLVKRLDKLDWLQSMFIVIDEAHHATSVTYRTILDFYKEAWLLGATATPIRTDGKGLGVSSGGVFDAMVEGPSTKGLIDQGHLSPFDYFAPPVGVDLSQVKRRAGDYAKDDLAKVMDKPKIIGSAVEHYHNMAPGRPALAFCVSVAHADHVAEQFNDAGYRAMAVNGKTPKDIRKKAIYDLGHGGLDVLCSCDIISEGTDIPIVEVAILLRPTQSLALFLQQCGRVLRPGEGKRALILDHVANVERHGFPDDEREWSLEGTKKKNKRELAILQIQVRQCTKCFKVDSPPRNICSHCGYIHPITVTKLKEMEGELVEMTDEDRQRIKNQRKNEQSSAGTMEELIALGYARKMKNPEGWAKHVWTARQRR